MCLAVNIEKNYIHRDIVAIEHNMVGSNLYEKVKTFKYLIHEEIKCRFKAGNLYYYSVQTLLYSQLLFKNLKIKYTKKKIFQL